MPEGVEIQITASAKGAEDEIGRLRTTLHGLQQDASNTSGTDQCRNSLEQMGEAGKMTAKKLETLADTTKDQELSTIKAAKAHNTFMNTVGKVTKMMVLRTMLRSMMKAMKEGIDNLYEWSKLHDKRFSKAMDQGATAVLYMKNSLATALAPVIIAIMPLIVKSSHLVNILSNAFAQLIAIITGQGSWTRALEAQAQYTTGIKDTDKKIKELLADWDELNVIQSESGDNKNDGMPSIGSMFETVELEGWRKKLSEFFAHFQQPLAKLLEIALAIKAAFLGIKFVKSFLGHLKDVKDWATTLWNKLFGGKKNLSNLGESLDLNNLNSNMSGLSEALNGLNQIDWTPLNNLSNLQWLKDFDFNTLKSLENLDLSGLNPLHDLLGLFSGSGLAKAALVGGGVALFVGLLRSLSSLDLSGSKKEVEDLKAKIDSIQENIETVKTDMNSAFDSIYDYATQQMSNLLDTLRTNVTQAMRRITILLTWLDTVVKPALRFTGIADTSGIFGGIGESVRQIEASLSGLPSYLKTHVWSIIEYDVQQSAAQIKADIAGIKANIETNYSTLSEWVKNSVFQPILDEVGRFIETLGGYVDRVSVHSDFALLPAWIKRNVLSVIEYDVQQSVAQIKADFAGVPANIQTVFGAIPAWINDNVWSRILVDIAGFKAVLPTVLDLSGLVDDWKTEFNTLPTHITGTLASVLLYCVVFRGLANAALNLTGMINGWKNELLALPNWIRDNPMAEILNNVRLFVNGVNGFLANIERTIDIYVVMHYPNDSSTGELDRYGGSRGSSAGRYNFPHTNLPTIPRRASGGLLNSGQLYVTRENGIPEYVGSFGNQGAVANNDQIVKGIADGVAEANSALDSRLARLEDLMERFVSKKFYAEVKPSTSLGRVVRQSEEMRLRTEGA